MGKNTSDDTVNYKKNKNPGKKYKCTPFEMHTLIKNNRQH